MNRSLVSMLFILFTGAMLYAQIPRTISYQGILTDASGNPKPDGDYSITFSFYDETGGEAIWTESKTLIVSKGLFSTSLGDQTPFGSNVKFDKQYFLGIKVGEEPELTPRIALTSAGYSLISDNALDIVEGKVVKNINGLKDAVTLEGSGGTTINTNGNTITISSSGSGGTGIQGIQNSNNTINITDPNGPTATINLKVPLNLSGSFDEILRVDNTSTSGTSLHATSDGESAIYGEASGTGTGVIGISGNGDGVSGVSKDHYGALGFSTNFVGVGGESISGAGVTGNSIDYFGVWGQSTNTDGVHGQSLLGNGVYGLSLGEGTGVFGKTISGYYGVYGHSPAGVGVGGESDGYGLLGKGHGTFGVGVYATSDNWYAGSFQGNVEVNGTLSKSAGSFKIDHPLDPANKYLSHSFVESPDMMNIYNGNATTDAVGNSTITLPDWFEVLNRDFRYQLTIIGEEFAQARVSQKISGNQFRIKTDKPNVEVSWQVTGIRKDVFAEKNRIQVEELKPERERGKFTHPELYGQPKEMGIHYVKVPEIKNRTELNIPQMKIPDMPGLKERQD